MKNMTKLLLTLFMAFCLHISASAQSINLVPNPNAGGGDGGSSIQFNGALYFKYETPNNTLQLAKYDGSNITLIANPDSTEPGIWGNPVIYNGNLYYKYLNAAGNFQLAKYDGSRVRLISNVNNTDIGVGYQADPVVYNGSLYFQYINASHQTQLARYDGSTISLIANSNGDNGKHIVCNGALYFDYHNSSGKDQLAKYDGTNLSLIANLNTTDNGFLFSPVVYNNNLYFSYGDSYGNINLAKYDGTSMSVIPRLNSGDQGCIGNLIVYNANLYFTYSISNAGGNYQLAKYDGTILSLIANPNTSGEGFNSSPMVYNGNLYFGYGNSAGKDVLAKYDGHVVSLIANPNTTDPGFNTRGGPGGMIGYNGSVYFGYINSSYKNLLAKYDGSNVSIIANVNSTDDGFSGDLQLFNGGMCFNYGIYHNRSGGLSYLATYSVGCTPTASITANSTNLDITGTRILTATSTNGGTRSMYRWYKNGSLISGATNSVLSYGGALGNGDQIYATITPVTGCGSGLTATSNTITFTKSGSTSKDITVFTMPAQVGSSVINNTAATVSIVMTTAPAGRTSIHPTHIVTSLQSGYSPSYIVNRDFSVPVTYTVRAQDGSDRVWTVTVLDQSGNKTSNAIEALSVGTDMNIYPNPATTYINVMAAGGADVPVITVLDIEGRVMYHQALPITNTVNHMIDLSDFATGTYFVHLAVGEKLQTKKFVVSE